MMEDRVVIASNHRDSHNEIITKEALDMMAETANGPRKVRWGVEHKRQLPPLGRAEDAKVEEREGYYYLTVRQVEYDTYEPVAWNSDLIKASFSDDQSPFVEPEFEPPSRLELSIDPNDFKSRSAYDEYIDYLGKLNSDLDTNEFGRKALLNDPEVVLRVAEYYLLYKFLTPVLSDTVKKVSDSISTKIAQDSGKLYDLIRNSMKEMILRINQKNRPINYVIKFPSESEIELFARTRNPEILINALKDKKVRKLRSGIDEIRSHTDFEKIQFILTDKGKWTFNYLLTSKGEAIGRRVTFKKRDRVLEYISKNKGKK